MPGDIVTRFIVATEQGRLDDALQFVSDGCVYDNVPLAVCRRTALPVAGLFVVSDGLITLWRDSFDRSTIRGGDGRCRLRFWDTKAPSRNAVTPSA